MENKQTENGKYTKWQMENKNTKDKQINKWKINEMTNGK